MGVGVAAEHKLYTSPYGLYRTECQDGIQRATISQIKNYATRLQIWHGNFHSSCSIIKKDHYIIKKDHYCIASQLSFILLQYFEI